MPDDMHAIGQLEAIIREADAESVSPLVTKILEDVKCPVCSDIMAYPFMMVCGHSACYSCLKEWFKQHIMCPLCRKTLLNAPVLNRNLRSVVSSILKVGYKIAPLLEKDVEKHIAELREEYNRDLHAEKLFERSFKHAFADDEDGVQRCSVCHWEVEGRTCFNCGTILLNVGEDLNGDPESIETSDEEIALRSHVPRMQIYTGSDEEYYDGFAEEDENGYFSDDGFVAPDSDDPSLERIESGDEMYITEEDEFLDMYCNTRVENGRRVISDSDEEPDSGAEIEQEEEEEEEDKEEDIFTKVIAEYESGGYFPQKYESAACIENCQEECATLAGMISRFEQCLENSRTDADRAKWSKYITRAKKEVERVNREIELWKTRMDFAMAMKSDEDDVRPNRISRLTISSSEDEEEERPTHAFRRRGNRADKAAILVGDEDSDEDDYAFYEASSDLTKTEAPVDDAVMRSDEDTYNFLAIANPAQNSNAEASKKKRKKKNKKKKKKRNQVAQIGS